MHLLQCVSVVLPLWSVWTSVLWLISLLNELHASTIIFVVCTVRIVMLNYLPLLSIHSIYFLFKFCHQMTFSLSSLENTISSCVLWMWQWDQVKVCLTDYWSGFFVSTPEHFLKGFIYCIFWGGTLLLAQLSAIWDLALCRIFLLQQTVWLFKDPQYHFYYNRRIAGDAANDCGNNLGSNFIMFQMNAEKCFFCHEMTLLPLQDMVTMISIREMDCS